MNVEIDLKGIHPSPKKLADGTRITYYYAWRGKGAPRLNGERGSIEFIESFLEATKNRPKKPVKILLDLLDQYTSSTHFNENLQPSTQRLTLQLIRRLRREKDPIGELPVSCLSDVRTEEILLDWRKNIALKAPASAQVSWDRLSAGLTWAVKRKIIKTNPCLGADLIYHGSRVDSIWLDDEIAKFCDKAPSHLVIAFMIALWTGQREGSLVKLRWSAYDGHRLTVKQDKNRRNEKPKIVVVPVMGVFKEFLDRLEIQAGVVGLSKEERDQRHILLNKFGRPWTSVNSFSSRFSTIVSEIVKGRTFHDLRGTAVTRLARAGCTVPQIATITGHALKTVEQILDKHYLHRDIVLAEQAMKNRDTYESSQLPSQLLRMM